MCGPPPFGVAIEAGHNATAGFSRLFVFCSDERGTEYFTNTCSLACGMTSQGTPHSLATAERWATNRLGGVRLTSR
jgi:hypothetical protein